MADPQGFQEEGRVQYSFRYDGFQHGSEGFYEHVDVTPSLTSGVALKNAIKDKIVAWYENNESENYDEWNNLLDNFIMLGGVL